MSRDMSCRELAAIARSQMLSFGHVLRQRTWKFLRTSRRLRCKKRELIEGLKRAHSVRC